MSDHQQQTDAEPFLRLLSPGGYEEEPLEQLHKSLRALSDLEFSCEQLGPTEQIGAVSVAWEDWPVWKAPRCGLMLAQPLPQQFVGRSPAGYGLKVVRPQLTRCGSYGLEGIAESIEITRSSLGAGPRHWEVFLGLRDAMGALQCMLPKWVNDRQAGRAWIGAGTILFEERPVKLLMSEDGARLSFRFPEPVMDTDKLVEFAHTAGWVLTFTLGATVTGEVQLVRLADSGEIESMEWRNCRSVAGSSRPCLPSSWSEWGVAQQIAPGQGVSLPMAAWSAAVQRVTQRRELAGLMELLTTATDAPLGMRGALVSVALEGLARCVGQPPPPPVAPELWLQLRTQLAEVIERSTLPDEAKKRLGSKLMGFNEPSNNDKLVAPFDRLGIALSAAERDSLKSRNRYLHGHSDVAFENWKAAYEKETLMMMAANKLLLHLLGLSGLVMVDQGSIVRTREDQSTYKPLVPLLRKEHFCLA
jgi:hypothetical protein